nr:immunoglobulin heavy chain junction region [Macaca mulatta]
CARRHYYDSAYQW